MNSDRKWLVFLLVAGVLFSLIPFISEASDDFTFELDEIEKSPLEWGGYVEIKLEHLDINQDGNQANLNYPKGVPATIDRFRPSLQVDGSYTAGIACFNWLFKLAGQQDNTGWTDSGDIYEVYSRVKIFENSMVDLGKKAFGWGKGYAWNPVGFVNRSKDPNDPQESLEGYVTGELELIKSFSESNSPGNMALTTLLIPVSDAINDEFGEGNGVNLAGKLYLLYQNTDIDFLFFIGGSRSSRFGVDFSRNITSNFEIHGEAAYITSKDRVLLLENGSTRHEENSVWSGLFGLRYLTANDLTSIIEYYHNGNGYTEEERVLFYRQITEGGVVVDEQTLRQLRELSLYGYSRPYAGRNYLYAKFTQKEPFDILYFTPGLTTIVNLDDQSASFTPELTYAGFTNFEIRLRFSLLTGSSLSEYGEKQIGNRIELRLRWFF
ncbi:hypothetical protein DGMP_21070 [Desulfomarina profundi]|uniref:Uncharacterized protein n=1 Tax=Desulfomarina profundi TaxID=2772557 RepID=A0A8D5JHG2_9BACT|nr:hypothetical protein [Desulfomarina profundi]BCL61414.1 hypothetical protein DGMP_21070 [Desulfomarina profundi]